MIGRAACSTLIRVEPIPAFNVHHVLLYATILAVPSTGSNQFQPSIPQYPAQTGKTCSTLNRVEPIPAKERKQYFIILDDLAVPSTGSNQFQPRRYDWPGEI